MTQIISILDSYADRTLVWDIYVERVARPATGSASDEQKIAVALPKATVCLSALAELMGMGRGWQGRGQVRDQDERRKRQVISAESGT